MTRIRRNVRVLIGVLAYVLYHPANEGQRLRALGRAAAFQVRGRLLRRSTIARVGTTMTVEAPLHATGVSKAVYANPPDWLEMHAWRRVLRSGDLFVDVGSNAGLYSLWAADCGALPLAVEPDPTNARRCRDNLARNGVAAEVLECALGSAPGTMRFTSGGDTLNHLVTSEDENLPSHSVEVRTLDDVLDGRHARGVKIDVEGAERLVLEGATEALREQRVDVFQIEWNAQSVAQLGEGRQPLADLLRQHGYVLCEPDEKTFALRFIDTPALRDADVFAVAPSVVSELQQSQ